MSFLILRTPSRESMHSIVQELARRELIAMVTEILARHTAGPDFLTIQQKQAGIDALSRMLFRDAVDTTKLPSPFSSVSYPELERLSQVTLLAGVWVAATQNYRTKQAELVESETDFYMSVPIMLNDELKYEPLFAPENKLNLERVEDVTKSLASTAKILSQIAGQFEAEPAPIPIDPPSTPPSSVPEIAKADDPFDGF